MNKFKVTYKPFGNKAVLVEWKERIDKTLLNDIISFKNKIANCERFMLSDLVVGYNSLTLIFDDELKDFSGTVEQLKEVREADGIMKSKKKVLWRIPVCYEPKYGIDILEISENKNVSVDTLIQLHSEVEYTVFFIGFLPGFLYLGGLNEKIHMNRKANPRLKVAKGSVAIGGSQTGVYPMKSPGGWNIIGRTPVSFFELDKEEPCFAQSGDRLQFYSVTEGEYLAI